MSPKPRTEHETENVISSGEKADTIQLSVVEKELQILWSYVIFFGLLHVGVVYGSYIYFFKAMWQTCFYEIVIAHFTGLGITAGAHRLWSHKSYKARLPLQIVLLLFNTLAIQKDVIFWVRDHRMHHKYSETNADPHNANRGFFFAHIGWLLCKRHPEFTAKVNTVDMSDLTEDPLLRFQQRYYVILALIASVIIPTYIPTLWGESVWNSFFVCAIVRYVYTLNATWLANSAAHLWGDVKPYDKRIKPVETKTISILTLGEGFHNYHHTFPSDYKTAELGNFAYYNLTTVFIDLMAKIGWAYDLKTVSRDVVHKRAQRTGDSSHQERHHDYPQ